MQWLWDAIRRVQRSDGAEQQRVVSELELIRSRRQSEEFQRELRRSPGASGEHAAHAVSRTPR
jgi:hypothetical protein